MGDDEYDPRRAPKTPAEWLRINNGADKGAKAWTIVAPLYIVIMNWRLFAAALIVAGLVIRFVRPDIWIAIAGMPGIGK